MAEIIDFFHTNDMHSHFETWPRIRRYLKQQQDGFRAKGDTVYTVDIGDAMDRMHPLTEATNGQINTQLLNQIGYDAVTIGNNEGIGNSKRQLEQLYQKANFPVVLANLKDKKTQQQPKWAQPYLIKVTNDGTRVAFIGMTAPYISTYRPNGWDPELIQNAMPKILAALAGKYDVLVLLSHLGITMDQRIAAKYPEFDVIMGGHTHHLLPTGLLIGKTMVAAAGRFGDHVGHVQLILNKEHQVQQSVASVVTTTELPSEADDEAEISGYLTAGHEQLASHVITQLPHALTSKPIGHSTLMDVSLAAVARAAKTEVALLNTGVFLGDFAAGPVTADDLHTVLPHAMHLLRVTLRGTDVWRLIMEIEKNRQFLQHYQLHGLGFRGKVFGDMVYKGITVNSLSRTVYWLGKPLDPEATYTLAGMDTYLYFQFFPTISIVGDSEVLFPGVLRNAVASYLKNGKEEEK
ncbi:multifunctional 2',3'-cyclic-nucleotide 2'-phosphodiesterase/5'-nucleotidase/3'-nucleotidase [Loigolactobacillus backii]|uniref:bifunctional metallophosphatase/5'-nucleotidase n=1 Tax=Loigolactobacillus backii TaxID=375175 RepID=UPI000C1C8DA6|nr:bifunctional UDP-sugar hydrolase/5'-nucleotidase [Loigolactobacillus backii]PIO83167.1 multifunctional 2',3'-cyclic-nucleotide 2'-phosphodiesterase/5'-nucleotidase/3'-nucleotidase [Loigolactobacillus backii]